jgi:signal transduction histidine kinase
MFQSAVNKLTAWYVAALLIIVLLFSLPIFGIASNKLDRATMRQGEIFREAPGRPLDDERPEQRLRREEVIEQERSDLLKQIIFIDILIVSAGAVASYYFAKRTLRPIEEAHEAQGRFTADASHELRTPLATMQAEIEVALRDKNPSAKSLQGTLKSNLEEIARLRGLSDQLLTLTKVDTNALVKKQFSLSKATVKRIDELQNQYSIQIKNDIKPNINFVGDEHLVIEVVTILVDNAVRYSDKKPEITLTKHSEAIYLAVSDKGIGIQEAEYSRIFERFYRGRNITTQKNGHGLGLSLAQEIATKSGGYITVESQYGKGSTFTLVLPSA